MSAKDDKSGYTPAGTRPDHLIRHATFRQLQIFESIFRLGSFTRAAEALFLTQPTVSMQIKKLGDAIGMPLFEHVGRSVRPTQAGQELYHACTQVFETLFNLETRIADLQGLKRGRLRVCVITNAKYLAPEMLGEFSQQYPGIDLALKVTNRERILERMQDNEDDLYIMGQAPDGDLEMKSYMISPNPLVVMASRDHPLVGKKNISMERICEESFIMREPGSGTRDATLRKFAEANLRPAVRMELGSNEAIKHAVVGRLGLAVLSLHTLALEGPDGPVAILDVNGFPIMRNWYIVYPRSKELSLAAQAFLDYANGCAPKNCQQMRKTWPTLKKYLSCTSNEKV